MNKKKLSLYAATFGTLSAACLIAVPTFGDVANTDSTETFSAPNGNTVEVRRVHRENEAGDVSKRRAYKVTDASGDLVRRGHDRARINADGTKSGAQRREFIDQDGNTYAKRRRAQADGAGNARAQRHVRVKDSEGKTTKRARSSGKKFADGSRIKRNQRQFTDAQGRKTEVRRKVRVDNQGNRRVQRRVSKG